MTRVCLTRDVYEAKQFVYTGDIDGPEATARAKELGLSTNGGFSMLWEINTDKQGWKIVNCGDWVLYRSGRPYTVAYKDDVTVVG